MNVLSVLRGLVAASFPVLTLAIAAAAGDAGQWVPAVIVAHVLLPVIVSFSGRRADALALDVGLVVVGGAYLVVMAVMPRGAWSGGMYVAVAVAYVLYAVLAAALFGSLSLARTAMRVRGFRRLRAERVMVRTSPADAE